MITRSLFKSICASVLFGVLLSACGPQAPVDTDGTQAEADMGTPDAGDNPGGNFVSVPVKKTPVDFDIRKRSDWPAAEVVSGKALISCETEYAEHGDGEPLVDLDFFSVVDALSECRERGVLRLRYEGRIASDFSDLVARVAAMADRMEIKTRILDLHSAGGLVEDAIRAGDSIGGSHWTLWVREGSVCHSACVLILASGDKRLISGKVGIHRIIRLQSAATTRTELTREVEQVQRQIEAYLERNGASVSLAGLMMTVPNRRLRLLTPEELETFGLDGTNAIQDDLDRIHLAQSCGIDFVKRKDAFHQAFDEKCASQDKPLDDMNACGLALRERFGFPDPKCAADSPMAELDNGTDKG